MRGKKLFANWVVLNDQVLYNHNIMLPRFTTILIAIAVGLFITLVVSSRVVTNDFGKGTTRYLNTTETAELLKYIDYTSPTRSDINGSVFGSPGKRDYVIGIGVGPDGTMPSSGTMEMIWCRQAGWPLLCLETHIKGTINLDTGNENWDYSYYWNFSGWLSFLNYFGLFIIFLKPLWAGLIVNTLFFAIALLLARIPLVCFKRRRRLDNKKCPLCSFDLMNRDHSSDFSCPECGKEIKAVKLSRPRQIIRQWMVPLSIPILFMFFLWFCQGLNWEWIRFELVLNQPILTLSTLVIATIACLWIFNVALSNFQDRNRRERLLLATCITAFLFVFAYIPLYIEVLWFSQ